MANETFRITCEKCKRSYSWKPERAGKKAKCQCGQIITMPMGPPKRQETEETADDLYGLAELAADAQKAPVSPSRMAVAAAAPLGESALRPAPLDYRNTKVARDAKKREQDSLTDPIRDLYVPAGLIVAGMLSSLIYVFSQTHLGINGVMILSVLVAILTAIKIGAMIFTALALAPLIGISFGILSHAILKFTAIIISIDAATLWVDVIFKATGAISPNGLTPILYLMFVHFALAVMLLGGLSAYLFSLDWNEVAMLAIPMAILSWIVGLIVTVILFALLAAFAVALVASNPSKLPIPMFTPPHVATPPTVIVPGGAAPISRAPAVPSTQPDAGGMTEVDHTIYWRIHPPNGRTHVMGANKWKQMLTRSAANDPTNILIDQMYGAGAVNVYIDLVGGISDPPIPGARVPKMYVELPAEDSKATACFAVAKTFRTQRGQEAAAPVDAFTKKYLVVDLGR